MLQSTSPVETEFVPFLEAGRRAWPGLPLERELFLGYVAERLPDCSSAYAADMYLACACVHGVAGAMEAFERAYADLITRMIERAGVTGAAAEDAAQTVRARLLVADDGPPKIAQYTGHAALQTWLKVVASRTALMAQRTAARKRKQNRTIDDVAGSASPELILLKRRHAADFKTAITRAFERLSDTERTILRLYIVDRVTFDALGAIYKVGHSTAARWVASARNKLAEATRRELRATLRVTDSDYDSLAALVQSQLDISVRKLLQRG